MVTDPLPRTAALRREYVASDAQLTLALPPGPPLQSAAAALQRALAAEEAVAVRRAGKAILALLADFYAVRCPKLTVLGARPRQVFESDGAASSFAWELFGDYAPDTELIRLWMRTAVLEKVTSFRGLLNTLLHEFCHHLDIQRLGFSQSPHTRGFFGRVDELYHLALATPPAARRPLIWRRFGGTWRIDWRALRTRGPSPER